MLRTAGVRVLVVLLLCVAWRTPTWGQSSTPKEEAQALLRQGNARLAEGLYLDALALFEKAYSIYPSPKLHFSIATAHQELGRSLEALRHFETFVRAVREEESPREWKLAHERIFKLEGSIATLQIHTNVVDALVTADGVALGKTPLSHPVRFAPGAHVVLVSKPGYEKHVIELVLKAGDALTKRVQLFTEVDAAATRRAMQQAETQRRAAQERLRRAEEDAAHKRQRTRRVLRTAGWSMLGTGAALALGGATCGILFRSEMSTIEQVQRGTTYWKDLDGHYDWAGKYRQLFYVGIGVGGALLVGGGILVAVAPRWGTAGKRLEPDEVSPGARRVLLLPQLGPQIAGMAMSGRF